MNKEEFYDQLFGGQTDLQELFEGYKGGSFSDLHEYVMEKAQIEFHFPNDNPELKEGRRAISIEQRSRFSLFSRTLEEGTDYSPEGLTLAKEFLAGKSSFISSQ